MTKSDFLRALSRALSRAEAAEREKALGFYGDLIDDRMEEGMDEESAVAAVGSPEDAAAQVLADLAEEGKLKSHMSGGKLALIICTGVIWLPLLIAFVAIVFSLWVSLAAVLLSLCVAALGCVLALPAGIIAAISAGMNPRALVVAGMGVAAAGCGMLLYLLCRICIKKFIDMTAWLLNQARRLVRSI